LEQRTGQGWRFEVDDGGPAWHYGLDSSRLVVTVAYGRVMLHIDERDKDRNMGSVEILELWLDRHEAEFEGFTPLQREILDTLLPQKMDEWARDPGSTDEAEPDA
ncbi:MAG: hypothetical protein ACRDXC_09800, partial [Acidimicrobiales bacterium]